MLILCTQTFYMGSCKITAVVVEVIYFLRIYSEEGNIFLIVTYPLTHGFDTLWVDTYVIVVNAGDSSE